MMMMMMGWRRRKKLRTEKNDDDDSEVDGIKRNSVICLRRCYISRQGKGEGKVHVGGTRWRSG
jgi:hypothetical protein